MARGGYSGRPPLPTGSSNSPRAPVVYGPACDRSPSRRLQRAAPSATRPAGLASKTHQAKSQSQVLHPPADLLLQILDFSADLLHGSRGLVDIEVASERDFEPKFRSRV